MHELAPALRRGFLPAALLLPALAATPACAPAGAPGAGHQLVLTDLVDGRVRAFDAADGAALADPVDAGLVEEVLGDPFEPSALAWDEASLYLGDFRSGRILAVDRAEPELVEVLHDNDDPEARAADLRLEEPADMRLWGELLVVLGNDSRNLLLVDPAVGAIDSYGEEDPIRHGHALTWLGEELVVGRSRSSGSGALLEVWDPELGEQTRSLGHPDELGDATALLDEPGGTLLVLDFFGSRLMRVDPVSGAVLDEDLALGHLDRPRALDRGPEGDLYILDEAGVWRLRLGRMDQLVRAEEAGLRWPRQLRVLPAD